ncbi:ANTAR domain-containing protein [Amycolatopsis sp. NPDC051373]|uniref:ANTAR domain-containing protein n=1 Tax=Amycolatopsis sp. NPDC051373 TaxID=3155801 RepID=UPI00344F545E
MTVRCRADDVRHLRSAVDSSASAPARVVVLVGDLAGPELAQVEARLLELVGHDRWPVVLDLSRVSLLSAAGVRMVLRIARTLAGSGRANRVVAADGVVRRVLRAARADDVVEIDNTVEAAEDALRGRRVVGDGPDVPTEQLAEDIADLRTKLAVRPLVAQALGLLQERYRLPDADADAAQALLRDASQALNVRLVEVAATVLKLPRPTSANGSRWLTGSLRPRQPDLGFAVRRHHGRATEAVLDGAAQRCLSAAEADAADAWLVQPDAMLRMAAHTGLPRVYVDHFERAALAEAACAVVLRTRQRVVVPDVGDDPIFAGTLTEGIVLAAGFHALQSTPVRDPDDGRVLVVLSTLHHTIGHTPAAVECATLDHIAGATARWLRWQHDDTLLAAAEHCHSLATGG